MNTRILPQNRLFAGRSWVVLALFAGLIVASLAWDSRSCMRRRGRDASPPTLLSGKPSVEQIVETACAFGQHDDITVPSIRANRG